MSCDFKGCAFEKEAPSRPRAKSLKPLSVPLGCSPAAIKLFVGNIPKSLTEEQLLPLFARIGKVVELVIVRDRVTNKSKGSAFVWYQTREQAEEAIQRLNKRRAQSQLSDHELQLSASQSDASFTHGSRVSYDPQGLYRHMCDEPWTRLLVVREANYTHTTIKTATQANLRFNLQDQDPFSHIEAMSAELPAGEAPLRLAAASGEAPSSSSIIRPGLSLAGQRLQRLQRPRVKAQMQTSNGNEMGEMHNMMMAQPNDINDGCVDNIHLCSGLMEHLPCSANTPFNLRPTSSNDSSATASKPDSYSYYTSYTPDWATNYLLQNSAGEGILYPRDTSKSSSSEYAGTFYSESMQLLETLAAVAASGLPATEDQYGSAHTGLCRSNQPNMNVTNVINVGNYDTIGNTHLPYHSVTLVQSPPPRHDQSLPVEIKPEQRGALLVVSVIHMSQVAPIIEHMRNIQNISGCQVCLKPHTSDECFIVEASGSSSQIDKCSILLKMLGLEVQSNVY